MNEILTAALAAAEQGWPVFMLGRSKRPVANCHDCRNSDHNPETCGHHTCHGFYAASTDPHRITAMVRAVPCGQLAVRTGAVSGLLVVDIDPDHGGNASFANLIARSLVPRTLSVQTGSWGTHLYYRHPGQHMPSRPMPRRKGIDIKADGGYVVLPPSIHHRTGRPYQWRYGWDEVEEMPPALVTACLPPMPAKSPTPQNRPITTQQGGGISHPDKLLNAHLDAVRRAAEGHRRTTLYGAARGVARMVAARAIEHTTAVAALTEVGREAGQTEREIRAAIAGGFHDEGIAA
jgi:hypothetical protein